MRTSPLLLAVGMCGLVCCFQHVEPVRGDEIGPAVISDEAQRLIDAMIAARRELKSGIFTATVRHTTTEADGVSVNQKARLRYVFDHPEACLRYEYHGEAAMGMEAASEDPAEVERQIKEGRYITKPRMRPIMVYFTRNGDYSAGWSKIGNQSDEDFGFNQLSIRPPEDHGIHCFSTILNPSVVGMTDERDLRSLNNEIEVVLKRHSSRVTTVSLKHLENGCVQLHYDIEFNLGRWRRTLEIDPANGFTCRRMTISLLRPLSDSEPVPFEVTADWVQRNGIWVPIRTTLRSVHLKKSTTEYDCVLDWAEVNPARINPLEFDYHMFEHVSPGTKVYDRRNGNSELIEIVDSCDESVEQ
ncbi:hypothetical protein [Schlesneria paludicola]|uniref:hypothetical protein n=1 Tax=Schlesneria paludicola TaxID=360056 RepID=UPI00029AFAE9|nr:hypothetical protein [Schlesneria paludicola]